MCESSKEALAENNLNLPKMAEKDGCFQSGFNEVPTCHTHFSLFLRQNFTLLLAVPVYI